MKARRWGACSLIDPPGGCHCDSMLAEDDTPWKLGFPGRPAEGCRQMRFPHVRDPCKRPGDKIDVGSSLRFGFGMLTPRHTIRDTDWLETHLLMSVIKNLDILETRVGRWRPSDIAFIVEALFQSDGIGAVTLRCLLQRRDLAMDGWPDCSGAFWDVELRFTGVRKFRLEQPGIGHVQVQGFDIIDHSSDSSSSLERMPRRWQPVRRNSTTHCSGTANASFSSRTIMPCSATRGRSTGRRSSLITRSTTFTSTRC